MKKSILLLTLALSLSSAHAANTWLGNIVVHNNRRGNVTHVPANGQTFLDNLADYNSMSVTFEYFQEGVTDTPGTQVWKVLDARVELVKDSTGDVIKRGTVDIVGVSGNNVIYRRALQGINPDTFAEHDPEMNNRGVMLTHLNFIINNEVKASIPFGFSYLP